MLPLFFRVAVSKWASRFSIFYVAAVLVAEVILNKIYGVSLKSPEVNDMYTIGLFNIPIVFLIVIFITRSYEYWHDSSIQKDMDIINEQQKTIESQTAFLTNMSHELRTPLNGIYGVFQILKQNGNTNQMLIDAGLRSTEALTTILSDILDAQKLNEGKVELNPEWVASAPFFNNIQHLYNSLADTKGISFNIEGVPGLPDEIYCDVTRVGQIYNNIIGNAFKFTETGSITIRCQYQNGRLFVEVADTGIGMNNKTLKSLFERFTQADVSTSKRFGGSGLGMAITRELITLMGGTINVKTEEGKGSVFSVVLPLPGREESASERQSDEINVVKYKDITILVVDDSEANALVASVLLEPLCKNVFTALNGKDALSVINAEHIDVVVSDIQMPVMDGIELRQVLKQSHPNLPVIALTGNAFDTQIEEYKALGFCYVIAKPLKTEELFNAIDLLLTNRAKQ